MSIPPKIPDGEFERYSVYLKSPEWKWKVAEIRDRSGGRCERCKWGIHEDTHHLNYDRLYAEQSADLLGVCHACHEFLHARSSCDPLTVVAMTEREKLRLVRSMIEDPQFCYRVRRLIQNPLNGAAGEEQQPPARSVSSKGLSVEEAAELAALAGESLTMESLQRIGELHQKRATAGSVEREPKRPTERPGGLVARLKALTSKPR